LVVSQLTEEKEPANQRWKSQRLFWRKSRDFVSLLVTDVGFF
jgi:hypothetical protein